MQKAGESMARKYDIGPRIGIDGEKEFRDAIDGINQKLKTLNTELKLVSSSFDGNRKSVRDLTSQNEVLNKSLTTLKERLEQQNKALEAAKAKYGEADKVTQGWQQRVNLTAAEINNIERQIKSNEKAIKNHNKETIKAVKKTDEFKDAQARLKKTFDAVKIAVVAVTTAIGASGKAAIDYESAFAGVRKTVDATEEELQQLSDGIRKMSREIPLAAADIAKIAENAGQLGIQKDNILGFTRVMADLGVATNLTGEEAAQTLAKFANITQMSQGNFDRLGSTIVHLGNNLATTEADIAAMSLRLAGAGRQVGMTEAQVLSFAGALSSVGIEAEMGGSAFSKVMLEMQMAAQTGEDAIAGFARVAGMSAKEFKNLFERDATGAIISFIEGLGKLNNAALVLESLGMKEVRLRDTLLRASSAGDVFRNSIEMGTKAWEENVALTNEASQRYETVESQLQMMKNAIVDAAITVGQGLLPQIKELAARIKEADLTPIINGFKWIIENGKLIISIIAGIGTGMLVWNAVQTIMSVVKAIQVWTGAMEAAKVAQLGLNAAIASNPIGLVISLVATLTAGLITYIATADRAASASAQFYNEAQKTREEVEKLGAEVSNTTAEINAKATKASELTDTLYDLNEQVKSGTLTEEEAKRVKQEMQSVYTQLKTLIPQVKIAFDNETGAIITQRDEVEKLIDSYIRLARAKAAQAKLEEIQSKLLDVELKKREAQTNLAGAEYNISAFGAQRDQYSSQVGFNTLTRMYDREAASKLMEATNHLRQSKEDFKKSSASVKEYEASERELQKTLTTLTEIIKEQGIDLGLLTQSTDNAADATGGFNDQLSNLEKNSKKAGGAAKSAAKESEKASKEAEKAAKEAEKAEREAIEKRFKDLKWFADMGYITQAEYYKQLEELTNTYYEEGSEEWQRYTLEIANYQKKVFEDNKKEIESIFDEIAKAATSRIDEVKKAQESLTQKLNDYAVLFEKVTIKNKDRSVEQFFRLNDMKKTNETLEKYNDLLLEVKERGADYAIFDMLRKLDIEEAIAKSQVLLKLTDEEFEKFNEAFQENRKLTADIAKNLTAEEMPRAAEDATNELVNALEGMTQQFGDLGENYAQAIADGFNKAWSSLVQTITREVQTKLYGLNLNLNYSGAGATQSVYSPTYYINGQNMTPAEAFAAASRQYMIDRIRGLIK